VVVGGFSTAAGGGDEQPSARARSWYMNEWSSVLAGPPWCGCDMLPPASDSWKVAYGEMSSEVSAKSPRAVSGADQWGQYSQGCHRNLKGFSVSQSGC